MGCDIHAYIDFDDYQDREGNWHASNYAHPSLGRNYTLFALMAGVRHDPRIDQFQPLFAARGLFERYSWRVQDDYVCRINDEHAAKGWEGYVTVADAHRWLKQGSSQWVDEANQMLSGPDWHSASWLTADELDQVKTVYEGLEFAPESWFQMRPPAVQAVPPGAVVRQLTSEYFFPGLGEHDQEWYVEVGERKAYSAPTTLTATIAALRALEGERPGSARLIFWFDN